VFLGNYIGPNAAVLSLVRVYGSDFPPALKNLSIATTNANLTWHAISNRTYRVQYTENLSANDWHDLPGDVCATNYLASKTDTTGIGDKQRFYRVLELQ
jgi:hypothetical protein